MTAHQDTTATDTAPMSFTWSDALLGAGKAWCSYMVILLVICSVAYFATSPISITGSSVGLLFVYLGYIGVIAGAVSLVAAALFSPVAWQIARWLRHETRITTHLLVYTALGCFVALVAAFVVGIMFRTSTWTSGFFLFLLFVAPVIPAVPLGWWRVARRKLAGRL